MSNIQKSIIQKVRDFLEIADGGSATELYAQLGRYRQEIHPDRFSSEESKKTAELKFNEAQDLLSELFHFIEEEATHKTPVELVLYKPVYDSVFLQHALDASRSEIADLKSEIRDARTSLEWNESQVKELKEELKARDDERFEGARKRLERMYKPSVSSWASIGIVFALSVLIAAMSKVKEVSDFISQYSPFSESLMKTTIFVVLILMVALTLKQYVENLVLRHKVEDVCSARFSVDFMAYLSSIYPDTTEKPKRFTESNVFDFIAGNRTRWTAVLAQFGFRIFQTRTYESLKNCFIDYLLKKELIQISYADGLDRLFTIHALSKHW
jgi:hypothetical protein